MKTEMTHKEIVEKLIGDIHPYGDSAIDRIRFENLKAMCDLVGRLIYDIHRVGYENKDRHEHSMKIMADYANNFLSNELEIKYDDKQRENKNP